MEAERPLHTLHGHRCVVGGGSSQDGVALDIVQLEGPAGTGLAHGTHPTGHRIPRHLFRWHCTAGIQFRHASGNALLGRRDAPHLLGGHLMGVLLICDVSIQSILYLLRTSCWVVTRRQGRIKFLFGSGVTS